MSAAEMVVKPQHKCPAADDSAPHDQPVFAGQPETSSESDAEEEEDQGGYQLLPQSEEDEGGRDQECDKEVYTHPYAHALGVQQTLQSRTVGLIVRNEPASPPLLCVPSQHRLAYVNNVIWMEIWMVTRSHVATYLP